MKKNPFHNRGMITTTTEFVGRIRELDDIIGRLEGKDSISIVGERKIGKSSLLYHLKLSGNELLDDDKNEKYNFVYIDMHDPVMKTPVYFAKKILRYLAIEYNEKSITEQPLIIFSELLETNYIKKGKYPIILIDEFEEIIERRELFNDDFIDTLRHCAYTGYLSFVISSKITLREITDSGKLTSPFWNIFTTIRLKEFAFDKYLNETAIFLEKYWENLEMTEFEKHFLSWYPSNHPLKLQIISYWVYQNRKLKYNDYDLMEKIKEEMSDFFRSDIDKITKFFKRELPKTPVRIKWFTGEIGQNMKNLGIKPTDILK